MAVERRGAPLRGRDCARFRRCRRSATVLRRVSAPRLAARGASGTRMSRRRAGAATPTCVRRLGTCRAPCLANRLGARSTLRVPSHEPWLRRQGRMKTI